MEKSRNFWLDVLLGIIVHRVLYTLQTEYQLPEEGEVSGHVQHNERV